MFGRRKKKKIKMPIERAACAYKPPTMQTQPMVPAALLPSPSVTGTPSLDLARDGHPAEDEMGQGAKHLPFTAFCAWTEDPREEALGTLGAPVSAELG